MKLLKVQERFIKSKPNEYNIIKGRSNTGKSEAILHRILNMSNNFAYEEEDKILVVQKEKNSKDNLESRYKDVKNKHDFKYVSLLSSKNDPEFITLSKLISKYSNETEQTVSEQTEQRMSSLFCLDSWVSRFKFTMSTAPAEWQELKRKSPPGGSNALFFSNDNVNHLLKSIQI